MIGKNTEMRATEENTGMTAIEKSTETMMIEKNTGTMMIERSTEMTERNLEMMMNGNTEEEMMRYVNG